MVVTEWLRLGRGHGRRDAAGRGGKARGRGRDEMALPFSLTDAVDNIIDGVTNFWSWNLKRVGARAARAANPGSTLASAPTSEPARPAGPALPLLERMNARSVPTSSPRRPCVGG